MSCPHPTLSQRDERTEDHKGHHPHRRPRHRRRPRARIVSEHAALLAKRDVLGDAPVHALPAADVEVVQVLGAGVEEVLGRVHVLELLRAVRDLVGAVGGRGVADEDAGELGRELLRDLGVGGKEGGRRCVADEDWRERIS